MPLSFLNPGLLVGLAAAAVPVIIHFLSRRRLRRVAFSDLRFLNEEEAQQSRRRGVRRWILLLLRVLIVICLVLAAARPHWGGLPGGAGRCTLFVLDASATMQTQDDDGRSLFDAAVQLVGEMITTLPTEASVQVIQAGPEAVPLFATWLPAGPAARSALAAARPTDGALDLAGAFRAAIRMVAEAPSPSVELVLISDLRLGDQPELDDVLSQLSTTGTRVLVRRMGDHRPEGAILEVALPQRALQPGETVTIDAIVRPDRPDQIIWLELDGRRVAETVAPIPAAPGGTTSVSFTVTVPPPGLHAGLVGKESDRLPVDDVRPFALDVPDQLEVLLAHGPDRDGLGRGGWRYLASALTPDSQSAGLFHVRSVPADSLLTVGLEGVNLLVMVDAGAPGRRLAGTLRPWLEAGGALLFLAGDPGQAQDLSDGILPLLGLPATATFVARDQDTLEHARMADPGHPLLADLGDEAQEALSAARWWRYFAVDEGESRVLLTADSGAPLLLEGRLGRGRWMLAPFHLRRDATDLMLNPVFLPLVQRSAARLVAGGDRARTQSVGDAPLLPVMAARLGLRPGDSAADLLVITPGDLAARPAELLWQPSGPAVTAPPSVRAGLTTFIARGDTLGLVATTVPAGELEAQAESIDDLALRFREGGIDRVLDLGATDASGLARALAGRDLARWLLATALMLLAVELWIGRRVG